MKFQFKSEKFLFANSNISFLSEFSQEFKLEDLFFFFTLYFYRQYLQILKTNQGILTLEQKFNN